MCVIIIVPQGTQTPSYDELKLAYKRNHDGCGVVTSRMYYRTLDFERFYKRIQSRKISENMIIHFRWATHGSVGIKNCHPFKHENYFFAHNGVLPIVTYNDRTDSQILFEKDIMPIVRKYGWASDVLKCELAYWSRGGSKFAMMHKGEIIKSGNFISYNGCYYSNLNHHPRVMYV